MKKKIIFALFSLTIFILMGFSPFFLVNAQGLVPCGRKTDDPNTEIDETLPCALCHFFVLFKRIIDFATINILFPLAVLMLGVGGIMFLTAGGDPGRIGGAKKILTATIIGLIIIFLAWLIINTVITFLTPANSPFQDWDTIICPICGDGNCEPGETSENCPSDCPPPDDPCVVSGLGDSCMVTIECQNAGGNCVGYPPGCDYIPMCCCDLP